MPGPNDRADPSTTHLPALDGVRGLAILLVLLHNLSVDVESPPGLVAHGVRLITAGGWVGVTLFFALSGYLITTILLHTRTGPHYLRNFFARRALRILPLYYVTLIVVLVIVPRLGRMPDWFVAGSAHQIWFWVYLSNWVIPFGMSIPLLDHFWSLAVEEQFYLVWPLVVRAIWGRRLAALCVALALVALGTRIAIHLTGAVNALANYYWTTARFDALALGALVAVVTRDARGAALLERWLPRALAVTAGAVVVLALATHGFPRHAPLVDTLGYSLVSLGSALLVALPLRGGARGQGIARRFFELASLRWLGRYSYGIYVIHGCLDRVASRFLPRRWLDVKGTIGFLALTAGYFLVVASVSCGLAYASYQLFERHFLALKSRFAAERPLSGA